MAKTLEQAIDEVLNDFTNNVKEAVRYASEKAAKDIYNYSMSCLEQYYANYNPTSYERTMSLKNAILPYKPEIISDDLLIRSTVGIVYDSNKLINTYYGSKKYQPVDDEYVLLNYLYGIHPGTNGARNPESVIYYERYDELYGDDSPWNKMEKYLLTEVPNMYINRIKLYLMKKAI